MDVRRLWETMPRRTNTAAIAIGVGVIALSWVVWEGPLMAFSNPEMDEWMERIGEEAAELDSLCRGEFEQQGKAGNLKCSRLRHGLAVTGADPVRATAMVDAENGRVGGLQFHVEPYTPFFETTSQGMVRMMPWEEAVQTHLELHQCTAIDVIYEEFGAWDCGEYIVVHSGVMPGARGRPSVGLWIAKSWEDVGASIHRRAQKEHTRRAHRFTQAAREYSDLGLESLAEQKSELAEEGWW